MPELREFRGTRLPASVISDVLYDDEVIELYVGRTQTVRVLMLPPSWANKVRDVYRHRQPIRMTRETLTAKKITRIVQHQVDADWKPLIYGVVTQSKRCASVVPGNAYWRGEVKARGEGGDE